MRMQALMKEKWRTGTSPAAAAVVIIYAEVLRTKMIVQSLDGKWELRRCGSDEVIPANVPGCVHLDLMNARIIEDPFYGDNESKVAWVHECDWEYSRAFEADERLLECDVVCLECDGLDTIADVTINGCALGRVDNMYIQHCFNVHDKLIPGTNTIKLTFHSPVNFVKPHIERDPLMSPGDSIPGSIYTRKCPSQWGWDWGPKLPSSGIWRSVRLAGYKIARIQDLRIRQKHHRGGQVTLNIEADIQRYRRGACTVTFRLIHPNGQVDEQDVKASGSAARWSMSIPNPQLWWPNGYGEQPLYRVEATLKYEDEELHSFTRTIGIRSLKLEQKKDAHGRSFTFIVNGVPIFCKGADWIPADQFPARITRDHYHHLISSAARANMNMLRVWGGGIYEDEAFYDLCDQYGILVWQDFMFSCAFYPTDQKYLDNCRADIEYNIVRLRNRACLALWCGNNEIEWFLAEGHAGDKSTVRKKQYQKIFHEFIPAIVSKLDPDTSYWPSSPSSGGKPFEDPNGQDSGDGHFWGVWHERLPFTAYRQQYHRFMSEFGFESMPSLETVKTFAGKDDLNMTSRVMECHQKNRAGNGLILYYLAQTFRFPKNFEMMCYVSQLLQAEAMRFGVEHWRRNRGRCMGTLYWQLNDCWPVSSWSSIDYYGRWKALQYFARRFYSPILLSIAENGTKAEIHVTNDTTMPAKIEVRWSLQCFDGTVLRKSKIKTQAAALSDSLLTTLDFSDELAGDAAHRAVLVSELLVNGKRAGSCMTSFVPVKHLELPVANISLAPGIDEQGPYVDVSTDNAARYVWLSVPRRDVLFSDNYFDLAAGASVRIRMESEIDDSALSKIRAISLRNSY